MLDETEEQRDYCRSTDSVSKWFSFIQIVLMRALVRLGAVKKGHELGAGESDKSGMEGNKQLKCSDRLVQDRALSDCRTLELLELCENRVSKHMVIALDRFRSSGEDDTRNELGTAEMCGLYAGMIGE